MNLKMHLLITNDLRILMFKGAKRVLVRGTLINHPHKKTPLMNGTAVYGELVVIVEVSQGCVNLKTGRISSTDSSHVHADNRNETVVFGDRQFYPVTDSSDDAYERSFRVDDIHVLKETEAQLLRDPLTAQTWFGMIYQDWVVNRIHRALKRVKRT